VSQGALASHIDLGKEAIGAVNEPAGYERT
jgi:hypothetical protein